MHPVFKIADFSKLLTDYFKASAEAKGTYVLDDDSYDKIEIRTLRGARVLAYLRRYHEVILKILKPPPAQTFAITKDLFGLEKSALFQVARVSSYRAAMDLLSFMRWREIDGKLRTGAPSELLEHLQRYHFFLNNHGYDISKHNVISTRLTEVPTEGDSVEYWSAPFMQLEKLVIPPAPKFYFRKVIKEAGVEQAWRSPEIEGYEAALDTACRLCGVETSGHVQLDPIAEAYRLFLLAANYRRQPPATRVETILYLADGHNSWSVCFDKPGPIPPPPASLSANHNPPTMEEKKEPEIVRYEIGDFVSVADTLNDPDDYDMGAIKSRRPGARGRIHAVHDSHGLCYEVKHAGDQSIGYYEHHELSVLIEAKNEKPLHEKKERMNRHFSVQKRTGDEYFNVNIHVLDSAVIILQELQNVERGIIAPTSLSKEYADFLEAHHKREEVIATQLYVVSDQIENWQESLLRRQLASGSQPAKDIEPFLRGQGRERNCIHVALAPLGGIPRIIWNGPILQDGSTVEITGHPETRGVLKIDGANSGRTDCSKPNRSNVPREEAPSMEKMLLSEILQEPQNFLIFLPCSRLKLNPFSFAYRGHAHDVIALINVMNKYETWYYAAHSKEGKYIRELRRLKARATLMETIPQALKEEAADLLELFDVWLTMLISQKETWPVFDVWLCLRVQGPNPRGVEGTEYRDHTGNTIRAIMKRLRERWTDEDRMLEV